MTIPTTTSAASAKKPAAKKTVTKKVASKKTVAPKPIKVEKPKINKDKRYKMLTGIDDSAFCQKVSDHLDAGYELYGSPSITAKGAQIWVGQAVILKHKPKSKKKK